MRNKTLILAVGISTLVALAGGGLAVGLYLKHQATIQEYVTAIQDRTREVSDYADELAQSSTQLEQQHQELEARRRKLARKENALSLRRARVQRFPRTIRSRVARRSSRYRLYDMRPRSHEPDGPYMRTLYDVELHGSLRRLKAMVGNLFAHSKAMVVDKIEVSLVEFGADPCVVKAEVSVFSYPRPELPKADEATASKRFQQLVGPMPKQESWEKIDVPATQAAQEQLDAAVARLQGMSETERRRHGLELLGAALDEWEQRLLALEEKRDENKEALYESAAKLADDVRKSPNGLIVARMEDASHLVYQ